MSIIALAAFQVSLFELGLKFKSYFYFCCSIKYWSMHINIKKINLVSIT